MSAPGRRPGGVRMDEGRTGAPGPGRAGPSDLFRTAGPPRSGGARAAAEGVAAPGPGSAGAGDGPTGETAGRWGGGGGAGGLEALRVPDDLSARVPAEQRGAGRDDVRLLVSRGRAVSHRAFRELPGELRAGDVLVVNTSMTLPAAVNGRVGGERVVVHFSTRGADGRWAVELRAPGAAGVTGPRPGGPAGAVVRLPGGRTLVVEEPLGPASGARLWWARVPEPMSMSLSGPQSVPQSVPGAESMPGPERTRPGAEWRPTSVPKLDPMPESRSEAKSAQGLVPGLVRESEAAEEAARSMRGPVPDSVPEFLRRYGRPIRYGYTERDQPLSAYQTVFAAPSPDGSGSAEMPSAARPFTAALVAELVRRGVLFAPLSLHTGVASAEVHEPPYPERFSVPPATAWLVNSVRAARGGDRTTGGRVIAVGTTAVRALESAAGADGLVRPVAGWTDLVVTPRRGVRVVDGLLTGLHEPRASHLLMLEAVAGREALRLGYEAALQERYLWHEFGDVHLLLRDEERNAPDCSSNEW
ncbi:S-adenosylmethionine:tRNA ribosyltransferase-isomerase [Streptomyces griseus]|uniref:S-adenosylmethionine:tRNA ribosyltransferase-isomerase n=1 Tax=Streptomyces griseus TaxID=1911 RepID=UPI003868C7FA|nr:S-adenosylmethionine:tRNA ribosyltransferase-isomerase [Streptomyces fimicarius]